ncbi:hypothetical protein GCM10010429_30680 [Micromonospora olivasterospora]|uniref:Acetyltransferase (GNAT) family protein n=1 Tax=Micromonospora olivasterospora TaxID=1880 RepID=A0A562I7Z9_MICOL|nr:hypothetical protein JD77_01752 [Micromonospora olivasterospora]
MIRAARPADAPAVVALRAMWSDYTATVPEHRGRGLARLAKTVALHRAAAGGVRVAYTSNDAANAPMLAINEALGYLPVASQWSCLRGG